MKGQQSTTTQHRKRWSATLRRWLRASHRDIGYLCVGLTFVYALSGLAVNHIADWDPNFVNVQSHLPLPAELTDLRFAPDSAQNADAAARVLRHLGSMEEPVDVYAIDSTRLDILLASSEVHVDLAAKTIDTSAQKSRFFLRAANFLHLNRGKAAWTYVADGYAVLLLLLATSGLFMIPGRRGFWGRGAFLAGIGAAVPIIYVLTSSP